MSRRGTDNRQKTETVMVRLTIADYDDLTARARREGTTRAGYLRRRIRDDRAPDTGGIPVLNEGDRALLANAFRAMGYLAGIMKRATFELPSVGRSAEIRRLLDAHHAELQDIQREMRAVLERFK